MTVLRGDSLQVLQAVRSESVDALVCDPPAGINFMGKDFDSDRGGRDQWIAWLASVLRECYRTMKPGAHALVWALPRTSHWTGMALEDAGFEVRDSIFHMFGSGFPKSLDVSKALDKRVDWSGLHTLQAQVRDARKRLGISQSEAARRIGLIGPEESLGGGGFMWFETGMRVPSRDEYARLKTAFGLNGECDEAFEAAEREVIGQHTRSAPGFTGKRFSAIDKDITTPTTDLAKQYAGFGTSLKPAAEVWWLARKPLSGKTVAQTVSQYGTGALNIDGCRIASGDDRSNGGPRPNRQGDPDWRMSEAGERPTGGRWPANVVLGCSCAGKKTGGSEGSPLAGSEVAGESPAVVVHHSETPETSPANGSFASHLPTCPVFLLDQQSGERKSGKLRAEVQRGKFGGNGVYGSADGNGAGRDYEPSSGGASRFFYTSKASRREREAGLEGMPQQKAGVGHRATDPGEYLDFVHAAPQGVGAWLKEHRERVGLSAKALCGIVGAHGAVNHGGAVTNWEQEYNRPTPDQWWKLKAALGFDDRYDVAMTETRPVEKSVFDDRERAVARNSHPTVKPLALMRWLCRLVTPPGGLILDPFAGSGSTGCAAILEGFRFLGIEREAEYVAISRARIAYWTRVAKRYHRMLAYRAAHPIERAPVAPDPWQTSLFEGVA